MSYKVRKIEFKTRGEADTVIERLREIAEVYGYCTVQDLYDIAGESSSYCDTKYGWANRDLAPALPYVSRVLSPYPYVLSLPSAHPLDEITKPNKSYVLYNSRVDKKEDINLLVRVTEMEDIDNAMVVINDIIQANRGRKINITIE